MTYCRIILIVTVLAALAGRAAVGQEARPEPMARVDRALKWISAQQQPDGAFAPEQHRLATTAACMIAMLAGGSTPDAGPHGLALRDAADLLARQSPENGDWSPVDGSGMRGQALVVLALSQVYGMETDSTSRQRTRQALHKAAEKIIQDQQRGAAAGGWLARSDSKSADPLTSAWCLLALTAAEDAGVPVPRETLAGALRFLLACYRPVGEGFAAPGKSVDVASTAAGLLGLCLLGEVRRTEAADATATLTAMIADDGVEITSETLLLATLAARYSGDLTWSRIWPVLRQRIEKRQQTDGAWKLDPSAPDRPTATAFAALALCAPLRLLPVLAQPY